MLKLDTVVDNQDCDLRIYENLPLPMVVLQGWFNDQHKCFELFINALTRQERLNLFSKISSLATAKAKYKNLWDADEFNKLAARTRGVHKLPGQLAYRWFSLWADGVSDAVVDADGLKGLLAGLGTVEAAHHIFKPWFYGTKKVRNLNAADAARVLARHGYLDPESRPLLARGALRGAAILLDGQPPSKSIGRLEIEYREETTRVALEERAAEYIAGSDKFSGRFQMEEGENWFCEVVHKTH
ncbi:MAG: hypothetical protein F4034_03310 [Chloroflexi bacterium]|nr:hypothetical protein [Chloroflexota bacterium]